MEKMRVEYERAEQMSREMIVIGLMAARKEQRSIERVGVG